MTLEIWLWIIAGIVVSEIIFILAYKNDWFGGAPWGVTKIVSFVIGGFFWGLNLFMVFGECEKAFCDASNYINLLWFYLVIAGIVLIFLINYKIKKWIDKK